MNKLATLLFAAFATAVSVAPAAHAQAPAPAPAAAATDFAQGEVRKVDKENRKVTLKHGEIKNLDMPPMTMVFQVNDAALLEKVQAGDQVRFKAVKEAGKYTVTEMQPAK